MSNKRESSIEREFVRAARQNGWKVVKFNTCSENGWPDRLCIKRGVHVYLEFKRVGEEPEIHQYAKLAELKRLGCNVGWFDNVNAAMAFLRHSFLHSGEL